MGNIKDLVSIIVPAYNAEKYIAGMIRSVLNQTYPHFEVIIVDDASEDQTVQIVRSFADRRIRLISHKYNRGVSAARNTALNAAKGRWVAVLDADDQWRPNRLERIVHVIRKSSEGLFVADDLLLCFDTSTGLRPWGSMFEMAYKTVFCQGGEMDINFYKFLEFGAPVLKPVFPLNHVQAYHLSYNENCSFGEDLEFICHLFRTGLKLKIIVEPLYLYRLTPGSLSTKINRLEQLLKVYERLITAPGFAKKERQLLKKQLFKVKADLEYMPFPEALKKHSYKEAMIIALKKPRLLLEFLNRLPSSIKYRITALKIRGNLR